MKTIFIIINPSRYRSKAEDCNTDAMVVMTDSMDPTISANDIIFGKDVPDGVLPLGTVVTFAVKSNEGYYLNTHREDLIELEGYGDKSVDNFYLNNSSKLIIKMATFIY